VSDSPTGPVKRPGRKPVDRDNQQGPEQTPAGGADDPDQQQLKAAYLEGHAEGYDAGYRQGLEDAKPKPTLFDACKQAAIGHADDTDPQLLHRFDEIEAEYGQTLIRQDRGLLLSIAKRHRNRAATTAATPASAPAAGRRRDVIRDAGDVVLS
jgi:hypothetical protein